MCWCVFCVIETIDRSDFQYTDNKMERQQRNTVSSTKTQTFSMRSSPYSPGLCLQSSFTGGLVLLCLSTEKLQYDNSIWVLLKKIFLVRVVLGFPKPLGVHRLFFFLAALWPLGLQWKEPNVMLSPERLLYGKAWIFKLFGAWCCLWSTWPSVFSA